MQEKGGKASDFRNILVAVAGQTPAIITETLWALEQLRGVRIDEIRVITTAKGYRTTVRELLGSCGRFTAYCNDYQIAPGRIAFSDKSIYVLTDGSGQALEDIRSSEDNTAAADQIFSRIKEWTQRGEEALFCSVAGGRKTLGIYLSMAIMLCGRSWDSLSHVLVSREFESGVPAFFYPPPEKRLFYRCVGSDAERKTIIEPVSSDAARVELADIPFLRLREMIGGEIPFDKGFTDAVQHCQLLLNYLQSPPRVSIRLDTGFVSIGAFNFRLPRQLMAVYAFFLVAFNSRKRGAGLEELFQRKGLLSSFEDSRNLIPRAEREG